MTSTLTTQLCNACSGNLLLTKQGPFSTVSVCEACGGVHAYATTLAGALAIVDFAHWAPEDSADQCYFDIVFYLSGTRERVRGWFDKQTKKMLQEG